MKLCEREGDVRHEERWWIDMQETLELPNKKIATVRTTNITPPALRFERGAAVLVIIQVIIPTIIHP